MRCRLRLSDIVETDGATEDPYGAVTRELQSVVDRAVRPKSVRTVATGLKKYWERVAHETWESEAYYLEHIIAGEIEEKFNIDVEFHDCKDFKYGALDMGTYYKRAHKIAEQHPKRNALVFEVSDFAESGDYRDGKMMVVPYVVNKGKPALHSVEHVLIQDYLSTSRTSFKEATRGVQIGENGYTPLGYPSYRDEENIYGLELHGYSNRIKDAIEHMSVSGREVPYNTARFENEAVHSVPFEFVLLANLLNIVGEDNSIEIYDEPQRIETMWHALEEKVGGDLTSLRESIGRLSTLKSGKWRKFKSRTSEIEESLSKPTLDYQTTNRALQANRELFSQLRLPLDGDFVQNLSQVLEMAVSSFKIPTGLSLRCDYCGHNSTPAKDGASKTNDICGCGARKKDEPLKRTTITVDLIPT